MCVGGKKLVFFHQKLYSILCLYKLVSFVLLEIIIHIIGFIQCKYLFKFIEKKIYSPKLLQKAIDVESSHKLFKY